MPKKIEAPEKPNRGTCDPDIIEEPIELPDETPVPIELPAPIPVPQEA